MPEPFKTLLNPDLVRACGMHLQRAWPDFDRAGFEDHALRGLEGLEMKARAMHIAAALEVTLPEDFDRAAGVIESALGPPATGEAPGSGITQDGLAGWVGWPLGEFIARRGSAEPVRGLQSLHALTQRFTSEFAIRPYLLQHFDLTLHTLGQWQTDPSAHVRRLVSEGTRPRLPWGLQIRRLIADPSPTLPLLRALQDDSSPYVRRSVANHLNDIARDHPGIVTDWLNAHLPDASPQRRALLRHASRTLLKKGEPRTLSAWGLGEPFAGGIVFRVSPRNARIGDTLQLSLTVTSSSAQTQKLAIDYLVHHIKANGTTSAKVFKGWSVDLAPHETRLLGKRHSLRPVTTRTYRAGRHRMEVQVNGEVLAEEAFVLDAGAPGGCD